MQEPDQEPVSHHSSGSAKAVRQLQQLAPALADAQCRDAGDSAMRTEDRPGCATGGLQPRELSQAGRSLARRSAWRSMGAPAAAASIALWSLLVLAGASLAAAQGGLSWQSPGSSWGASAPDARAYAAIAPGKWRRGRSCVCFARSTRRQLSRTWRSAQSRSEDICIRGPCGFSGSRRGVQHAQRGLACAN